MALQDDIRAAHEAWLEAYLTKQLNLQTLKANRSRYRDSLKIERKLREHYEQLRRDLISERVYMRSYQGR